MQEITVSIITDGNKIKDYVINNPMGAESISDLMNKKSSTFLPTYVVNLNTIGVLEKSNRIDVILRNGTPIEVMVNKSLEIVEMRLKEYLETVHEDDMFPRHYDLVSL